MDEYSADRSPVATTLSPTVPQSSGRVGPRALPAHFEVPIADGHAHHAPIEGLVDELVRRAIAERTEQDEPLAHLDAAVVEQIPRGQLAQRRAATRADELLRPSIEVRGNRSDGM